MKEISPSEYHMQVTSGRLTIDVTNLDGPIEMKADKVLPIGDGRIRVMELQSNKHRVSTRIVISTIDCIR